MKKIMQSQTELLRERLKVAQSAQRVFEATLMLVASELGITDFSKWLANPEFTEFREVKKNGDKKHSTKG